MEFFNPKQRWGNFSIIPDTIMRIPATTLSQGAKLLYARLVRYYDEETGVAYPGYETLATEVGVSTRQVADYVKELVAFGLLAQVKRGLGKTAVYRFPIHPIIDDIEYPDRKDTAGLDRNPPDRNPGSSPDRNSGSTPGRNTASSPSIKKQEEETRVKIQETTPPTPPVGGGGGPAPIRAVFQSTEPTPTPLSPPPSWQKPSVETCAPAARETHHRDESRAVFYDEMLDYCAEALGVGYGRYRLRVGQRNVILEHIDRMVIAGRSHDEIRDVVRKAMQEGRQPLSFLRKLTDSAVRGEPLTKQTTPSQSQKRTLGDQPLSYTRENQAELARKLGHVLV